MSTPSKRRRWFRFSLRTFLILIAAFAIPLGWYVNSAERQRRAVASLHDKNAWVQYASDDPTNHPMISDIFRKFTPTQQWIPIDYWSTVTAVSFGKGGAEADELRLLPALPYLQMLDISIYDGQDIAPIGKLKNLKRLYLGVGPEYVDLSPLASLKHLDELRISSFGNSADDTYATWKQIQRLRVALPDCSIQLH